LAGKSVLDVPTEIRLTADILITVAFRTLASYTRDNVRKPAR